MATELLQQVSSAIFLIAGTATSVITLYKVVKVATRVEKSVETTEALVVSVDTLTADMVKVKDGLDENSRTTHKLAFYNNNLPMDERIRNGEKYIQLGGNGTVKHHVQMAIKTGSIPVSTRCEQTTHLPTRDEVRQIVKEVFDAIC